MVKWKKMNKKMAGLLLGVMMLFTASMIPQRNFLRLQRRITTLSIS